MLVGRHATLARISYHDLYRQRLGIDPHTASDEDLRAALGEVVIDPAGLGRDDWLDLLMTHRLQPSFPADQMLAVYDYPASQCALARVRPGSGAPDGVPVAERFELYLGPLELANGYHELADAGLVSRGLVETWKRLRDSAAHAEVIELDKLQEEIDSIMAVATLFNQLVFILIGYQGKYTDYSERGFPVADFGNSHRTR